MKRAGMNRTGFSLIEVLIGVLVLALGLLGLAAVFPVVVREQRDAQDTILGVSARNSAEAFVNNDARMNTSSTSEGWAGYGRSLFNRWSSGEANDWRMSLRATGGIYTLTPRTGDVGQLRNDAGALIFPGFADPANPAQRTPRQTALPVWDRVFPLPSSRLEPQYVWDMAAMLAFAPGAKPGNFATARYPLRVAVFVRRVDAGLAETAERLGLKTVYEGLPGEGRIVPRVLPVSVNNGEVTLTGAYGTGGVYSQVLAGAFDDVKRAGNSNTAPRNIMVFAATWPAIAAEQPDRTQALRYLRQVGQKFVDTSGTVYTVTALPDVADDPTGNAVVVSPAVSDYAYEQLTTKNNASFGIIAFTPQIPVAVKVMTVRP